MLISVSFDEIVSYIRDSYKVPLTIERKSDRELSVKYKQFLVVDIVVNITVEEVSNDVVSLTYDCGSAMSLIVSGVVELLHSKLPDAVVVDANSKSITVYPKKIKGAEGVLQYLRFSDIIFDDNAIKVIITAV
ncbi:MAG: hypothetical protein IKZ37_08025 [Bacteroidaceae bacterium]|nr:hypothetical protein [Bacteroidaceae bacterium]